MTPAQLQEIMYLALSEPVGLLLQTSDRERARQAFYRARSAASDPALAELQFRVSPFPEGDLVICRQRVMQSAGAAGAAEGTRA